MTAFGAAAVAAPFGRDLEESFMRIRRTLGAARGRGAALVVLPECVLGGYLKDSRGGSIDLPPVFDRESAVMRRLIDLAGPTVVCAGYIEEAPGGPYNSAICVSGDGVLGHHRKVHLPVRDRTLYTPGDGFAAFDTPVGRLGMMICYDKVFPESARALALDGAETIACLSAWPISRIDPASRVRGLRRFRQFDLFDQARAAENQVAWVSANQTGSFGGLRFLGHAKVVDPEGHVLSRTRVRTGMAVARIDPVRMRERARRPLAHLSELQSAAYATSVPSVARSRPTSGVASRATPGARALALS